MLKHFTQALIDFGPFGLAILAFIDSTGIPVGGGMDVLLMFLAYKSPQTAWWCAGLAVLGSVAGNLVLYFAARKGGRRFLENAKRSPMSRGFDTWFERYGLMTVFVPAFVPFIFLPLKLFVVSAGVFKTPIQMFVRVVVLARVLRYFGEVWLGMLLGEKSLPFLKSHLWEILGGTAVVIGAMYAGIHYLHRNDTKTALLVERETIN